MKNKLKENNNLLISFKSIQEISEECIGYVDILDLKDPLRDQLIRKVNKLKKVIQIWKKKNSQYLVMRIKLIILR